MGIHKRLRLRKPQDFARLRREGKTLRHPVLTLSLTPNGLTHNRYGFVTGKKLGNAVIRNRIRRLMREAVRQIHPKLATGYDLVLIARPSAVNQPFGIIQQAVNEVCHRAKLEINED